LSVATLDDGRVATLYNWLIANPHPTTYYGLITTGSPYIKAGA